MQTVKTYTFQSYSELIESDVSATLKPGNAVLHGGGEVLVISTDNAATSGKYAPSSRYNEQESIWKG